MADSCGIEIIRRVLKVLPEWVKIGGLGIEICNTSSQSLEIISDDDCIKCG